MAYSQPLYSSAEGINPEIGGRYPQKVPETNVPETVQQGVAVASMYIPNLFNLDTTDLPALISSYLAGANTSSKKLPATKDSTV